MRIAILAATSFLAGRCAARLATHGHEVVPFARRVPRSQLDVLRVSAIRPLDLSKITGPLLDETLQCDAIVNCIGAGVQPNHREQTPTIWQANAFAPIELLEQLADAGYRGKVITFGSYFELGELNAMHLLDEAEFVASRAPLPNAYCRSKRTLTRYVADRHAGGVPFQHLHCILTNLYGPGENRDRLIPYIFRQVAAGQSLRFSAGTQRRQYTHVDDVAAWLTGVLEHRSLPTGIFNVTDDTVFTVREVIEQTLAFLAGKGLRLPSTHFDELTKRDLSMSYLAISAAKARQTLGWNPSISLEQGIASYHHCAE